MGLNPAALTTYDQSTPGAVVTRSFGKLAGGRGSPRPGDLTSWRSS
jgi:hypothetical protein